jgi:V/A-type H+-transporting ATPase subunit E
MGNKLQELTNKIYQDGVAKANEEAERLISSAKKEAETIRAKAEKEAARILEEAKKEAQEQNRHVLSELKLSARQAVSAIRQKITDLIVAETVEKPLKEVFNDQEFLKKIIEATIRNWNPEKAAYDLHLLLPAKDEKTLGTYFANKQKELLNGTLDISFDDRINAGFKIGPKDGRFIVSFTDKDFDNFFRDYLRPATAKLLYGEA